MKQVKLLLLLFVAFYSGSCSSASSEQKKAPAVEKAPAVASTASGKMTYKGITTKLDQVYAQDTRDLLDEAEEIKEVDILLSERPLSAIEPDKQVPYAVKIHIDKEGQQKAFVYVNGVPVDIIDFTFPNCPPRSGTSKFVGRVLEGSLRLSSGDCAIQGEKQNPNLAYEASFKAPIQPPDDKKIAISVRDGRPLPASGGEAGKAALAYFAILKSSADLEIELAKARNASASNENDIKQKQAQLDELFSKVKNLTPNGRNLEEAEPNELFALNVISNLEKYEILEGYIIGKRVTLNLKASFDSGKGVKIWVGKVNLILENGQWKILRVGMRMQEGAGGEMYW